VSKNIILVFKLST